MPDHSANAPFKDCKYRKNFLILKNQKSCRKNMIRNIIFDFGSVLVDWNPELLYGPYLVTWTFWVIKWVEKIKGGHFG